MKKFGAWMVVMVVALMRFGYGEDGEVDDGGDGLHERVVFVSRGFSGHAASQTYLDFDL